MKFKTLLIISILSLIFLIGAFFGGLPYIYFQILRWIISVTFLYLAYVTYERGLNRLALMNAIFVVLFQPIFPIYLDRIAWLVFDALAFVFISVSVIKIYQNIISEAKKLKPLLAVMEEWKATERKFAEIEILQTKENEVRESGNWKEADVLYDQWNAILKEIELETEKIEAGGYPEGF